MNQSKKPWTCGGCALVGTVTMIVLFFCIAISSWLWFQASELKLNAKVKSQIANLRDAGIPVDNATLDRWYKSQTSNEDSDAWCRILAYLNSKEFNQLSEGVEILDPKAVGRGPSTPGWLDEADCRRLLQNTEDIREEIRTLAAKRAPVRFPINFNSFGTLLPNTQNIRQAARLLSVEFDVALADSDSVAIRQAIETQFHLTDCCRREPFLVSQLVCIACDGIAYANLKKALELNRLAPDDLQQLLETLQKNPDCFQSWRQTIQGERAMMLPMFDQPLQQMFQGPNSQPGWGIKPAAQDKLNYLSFMDRIESIDVSSIDSALAAAKTLEQELKDQGGKAGILGARNWMLTSQALPAISAAINAYARTDMKKDQAMIAIAIRLYQAKHGSLPSQLGQLQEFGIDTSKMLGIADKPYGYLKSGKTAQLWGPMPDANYGRWLPTKDSPPQILPEMDESTRQRIQDALWDFND
jgi:hypothetical protein